MGVGDPNLKMAVCNISFCLKWLELSGDRNVGSLFVKNERVVDLYH